MNKTQKLIPLKCSPKSSKTLDFTCFDDKTIYKLRDLWNLRHQDSKIMSNDMKDIWESLKVNMSQVCNKESCWLKQQFTGGELDKELETSFAPESPKE